MLLATALTPTHQLVGPAPSDLPSITELMALLGGRPHAFHAVLIRVDRGEDEQVARHVGCLLQGRGCIFRIAPGLLAVQLPATIRNAGNYLIEAIGHRPPTGTTLRLSTRSWSGGGAPVNALRAAYEELMSDRLDQLAPLRRGPPPLPKDAEASVDIVL